VTDHLVPVVEELVRSSVPGLVVAVAREGRVTWMRPSGVTSVIEGRSTTSDTAYLWFSMTKIATATAAVQLAESKALALDDPVSDYVPEFPGPKSGQPVTVRHLLNHTAGLANPIPVGWVHPASEAGPDPHTFATDLLRRKRKVAQKPGARAAYSNLGYVVLGEVLTAVAGQRIEDYIRDWVLTAGLSTDLATGHQPRLHPLTPLLRLMVPAGVVGPSRGRWLTFNRFAVNGPAYGGLIGSGADAARFLAMHTGDGALDGTRILSPGGAQTMRQLTAHGRKLDVGLGWFNRHSGQASEPFVEHLGGGGGFWNMMRLYPRPKLGVLTMGNATSFDHQRVADVALKDFVSA
jgi:CubicO group peptidase (beta-lactamase class C family)